MQNSQMVAGRFLAWHAARVKLAWIKSRLDDGMTVYLSTSMRHIKIQPKHFGMLRATKSGLYVAERGKLTCCNHCRLSAN